MQNQVRFDNRMLPSTALLFTGDISNKSRKAKTIIKSGKQVNFADGRTAFFKTK